jgi:aryl-alcohol dehydrogenase-like predicted oxidoreductase
MTRELWGGPRLTRAAFLKLMAGAGASLAFTAPGAGAAEPMTRRPIPSNSEMLPVIGVGTSGTFDIGTARDARAQRAEVLRVLFEASGSVIDTSPMYGRAEGVVGELLGAAGSRKRAFIATKVWTRGRDAGIRQMEDSARLLGAPVIDLMQVHNLVDWRTQLKTLRQWKEEGRIRYIGITHYTSSALDDLGAVIAREPLDFVQFAYSIRGREAERRMLPLCAERGVATLINRPFEDGGIFRRVRGKALPAWAADFDCRTWGQFLLKFILAHPAVTCIIPGTSKPKHMADNAAAGTGRLPDAAARRKMIELVEGL